MIQKTLIFLLFLWQQNCLAEGHTLVAAKVKGKRPLTLDRMSQRDLQFWERKKDDKDHSSDDCEHMAEKHGITCAPSQSPSSAPSVAPSISMAPTLSSQPSSTPSSRPTSKPSATPSSAPSWAPSVSQSPSSEPSAAPTGIPSATPTSYPTGTPSARPTSVLFTTLQLTREDGSVWEETTCEASLPLGASAPQAQETIFEYFLHVTPDSNPNDGTAQVERALSQSLSEEALTCLFMDNDAPFELYSISSLPMDTPSDTACPDEVKLDGAECYRIRGGFTPTVFYSNRRRSLLRRLQNGFTSQTESEIIAVFGPILENLLDSDMFVGGDVVATSYSGFLVNGSGGADFSNTGTADTSGGSSSIQGNAAASDNGGGDNSRRQYVIAGAVVASAAVALVVISLMLVQRRRNHHKRGDFEECNDSVLDSDDEDSKQNRQEGFPGDGTRYIHNEEAQGIEVNDDGFPRVSSQQSAAAASSVSGSVSEAAGKSSVQGLRYSVVNDDETIQSSLYGLDSNAGNDTHDYENCKNPSCFKCRARELPQPTFVQADLLASIQSDLGSNKTYRPKHQRTYVSDDTVDL